jgi:WD40 repeat protein
MNLTLSPSHTDYVAALAFSSDHSYLASGSKDGFLNLWNAYTNWTLMFRLNNNGHCYVMIQLPNGQLAAGSGNNINIWDPLNNVAAPIRTLIGHTDYVYGLSLSPDASLLASSSQDTNIKLWNYASQTTALNTLSGHSGEVRALCFVSNQLLASGSFDNSIKVWNVNSGI